MSLRRSIGALLALCWVGTPAGADEMTYWYDDLGRLARVMDQTGGVRTYEYDAVGNILAIRAGDGDCPAVAPTSIGITPTSCRAGTSCHVSFVGRSLLGGAVGSSTLGAALTHCREVACGRIDCRLTPDPFLAAGPVAVTVTTPLGATEQTIEIEEPARLRPGVRQETWRFAGNAGELVTLAMTRIVDREDGSSGLDPLVEIRDSRGNLLQRDDDSGSALPPGPGRNAVIESFRLPATDVFRVVATGRAGTTGAYVLDLEPASLTLIPGAAQPPREPDLTFEGTIAVAPLTGAPPVATFRGEISRPTARNVHTFPANAGTVVSIEVGRRANRGDGSGSLDPAVELRDSRGFLVRLDSNGGSNVPPGTGRNALIANLTVSSTDTYRVVVTGSDGTTGPYEVRIFTGRRTLESGSDVFAVPAAAGRRATVVVTRRTAAEGTATLDPRVELRDSRRFVLATNDDGWTNEPPGPGRNAIIPRIHLPASDEYRLVVTGSNATVGPYRAEVFFVE